LQGFQLDESDCRLATAVVYVGRRRRRLGQSIPAVDGKQVRRAALDSSGVQAEGPAGGRPPGSGIRFARHCESLFIVSLSLPRVIVSTISRFRIVLIAWAVWLVPGGAALAASESADTVLL